MVVDLVRVQEVRVWVLLQRRRLPLLKTWA
jgi:hypothetical protein